MPRYYDDWLRAFVEFASYGEAPLKTLFWTGVSTLAGALRRRVWIDQKYFQWLPNFYVILVAPPGVIAKSTTANIGMNLLRGLPPGTINFGPDAITWQALITSLAKSTRAVPDPRDPGTFYPMSAVTFCSDELGNLLNPKDRDLVDALVTLWDGKQGAFKKETKMSGSDKIENPWVNIIGCTTPAWISDNVPEYMIGGGLFSRCVFVYAEEKRQLVPYVDEVVPVDFEETKKKLIHDLEQISLYFGEFQITPAAREWGRAWYIKLWEKRPQALAQSEFSGYIARKQTHIHKLAMVLSASRGESLKIEPRDLKAANDMVSILERDMPKVFARIGQTTITRGSTEILVLVQKFPGVSRTELYRMLFRSLSYRELSEAINGATISAQVQILQEGNEIKYYPKLKADPDESQNTKVH